MFYRLFRRQDNDKSWTLSREEMAETLKEFSLQLSDEEVKNLFDQFDANESGTVNYEEFLDSIRVSGLI